MTAKRKGAPARRTAGNFLMGVLVLTAAVLMNGGILASRAEAVTEVPMLEVTGTLERVEPMEDGERLVLNVNGKEASGPLFSDCHFLDERGTLIPREDFLPALQEALRDRRVGRGSRRDSRLPPWGGESLKSQGLPDGGP